jgi:N-acetylmuramoyl-L-alanine amidase
MTDITQDLIPAGSRNRPGKANTMTHITIHNTGNASKGADAAAHARYIKDGAVSVPVSWHYTVDEKRIIRHVPDGEIAYHAGTYGNPCSIGVEICMNGDGNLEGATDNAAGLAAFLCREHGIPVENVVQHNHWKDAKYPNGKDCPQMLRQGKPYGWDDFLQKVRRPPEPAPPARDIPDAAGEPPPSDWAAAACGKAVKSGLIKGDGAGWFGWKEPVLLERLLVVLDKLGMLG